MIPPMGPATRPTRPTRTFLLAWALALAGLTAATGAMADVEAQDAQGRRYLLKDDGTWQAVEPAAAAASDAASAPPAAPPPQAVLTLQRRADEPAGCRFEMTLDNTLGYEIRMLTPEFTVFRADDVAYSAKTIDFGPLRPGDRNLRRVLFGGISCGEIAALRVGGGDRCVMGELTKFSDVKGECLARVDVRPSDLLPFEKAK
jgi:hypothetical protein